MKIVNTANLSPETMPANASEKLWIYNGLDCCVTYEVLEAILPELDEVTQRTYSFSRELQGPILEMNMRGLRVDMEQRDETLGSYLRDIDVLTEQLDRVVRDGLGYDYVISKGRRYKYPSDDQWKYLFYELLRLPPIRKRNDKGELTLTVNRAALERLEGYFDAEPLIRRLLLLRDLGKKVSFLRTGIDPDGRLRTSFNIAGTTTGRLASSFSDFGTGTNLQNVENRLRRIFIPDEGYLFGNIDLAQSDSRGIGAIEWNLFRDSRYLDACESGDLHTAVARMCFSDLPWTGQLSEDRSIAEQPFYRSFKRRDVTKRLGHGTNFMGEPDHMAKETHIPAHLVRAFHHDYLEAFPAHHQWWDYVKKRLRDTRTITTLLGRRRTFFGKSDDPETIKRAVAYEPQSITADTINAGLLKIWRHKICQPLLQVHDSILFQFPREQKDEVVNSALALIEQKVELKGGREFVIPGEVKTGMNWADRTEENPDGLK